MSNKKRILVSVGTTEFEPLIQYIDSEEFLNLIGQIDERKDIDGKPSFKSFEILSQIGAK